MKKSKQQALISGFTMVEVLLVSVLLFALSYAVYVSVKGTLQTQQTVESRTLILQEFRSAYGILQRDLRSAYFVTAEDLGWNPHTPDPLNPDKIVPVPTKPTPITLFQGKENSLFFSTRTHQRLSANTPENEEHFVFYELKGSELYRSESRRAIRIEDRERPEEFRSFVLINKVNSLRFSFWNQKQGKWVTDWDSERSENINKIPDAVKIEVKFTPEFEVASGSKTAKKAKELVLVTAIRLPEAWYRNIDWSQSSSAGSTGGASGGGASGGGASGGGASGGGASGGGASGGGASGGGASGGGAT